MWADLDLPTPWPKPDGYVPPRADDEILVWGAASSVGQYALQILRFYGYRNLIATASPNNHQHLRGLGASAVYDYRSPTVVEDILAAHRKDDGRPTIPLIIDCIGSVPGTIRHIVEIAQKGGVVAIMLPVILKHATKEEAPEYSMDVVAAAQWAEGVIPRGVRTHFFWKVSHILSFSCLEYIYRRCTVDNRLIRKRNIERILCGEAGVGDHAGDAGKGDREAK